MSEATRRFIGASILSIILLAFGVYVLLHGGSSSGLEKAATGWIGLVIGYWFK